MMMVGFSVNNIMCLECPLTAASIMVRPLTRSASLSEPFPHGDDTADRGSRSFNGSRPVVCSQ